MDANLTKFSQKDLNLFPPPQKKNKRFKEKSLKGNAAYLKKIIMYENDALSEYNKIPLGHNRTNVAGLLQNLLQS